MTLDPLRNYRHKCLGAEPSVPHDVFGVARQIRREKPPYTEVSRVYNDNQHFTLPYLLCVD